MANISPKLFQKAIQQGLKTALFTTSTAALMLTSSGAFGAATIDANATFSTGVGMTPAAAFGGGTLQYIDDAFTVDADEAVNITAIDVNGKAPALFTVNKAISLGSVNINGGAAFPVSITDTFTLTLTGTDGLGQGADTYDGLGAITLNGATSGLTINSGTPGLITLDGAIDGTNDGEGILKISTPTIFTAAIGATHKLASITVDAGGNADTISLAATNIIVNDSVDVINTVNGAINLAAVGINFTAGGLVTGTAVFNANAKLTLGNGISADITAVGNNGTVVVGNGNIQNAGAAGANSLVAVQFNNTAASTAGNIFATNVTVNSATTNVATGTVNGAIDFAAAGKLKANGLVTGTAEFNADGTLTLGNGITGGDITSVGGNGTVIVIAGDITNVGLGGNSIKQLTFNNVAASNAGNIFATNVTVNNAGTNVAVAGTVNGAINFAQAGQLSAAGLVTGTAVFNADGTLTLGNGITGAVTSVGNNGTLIVDAGNVVAAIGTNGGANILKQVTFNGASNVTTIDATNVTINNGAADVTAAGAITAAVNFAADGELTANNGITGAVTAVNGKGTLTTAGVGVTGAVGVNGNSLKVLNANVDDAAPDLVFTSDIYAQAVNFASVANAGNNAVGTIQVGGNLIATNVNFSANAAGGVLDFNGGGGPYDFKGAIANGINATLNINTALVTAYHSTIGTVKTINIGATKNFAIDTTGGNVDILNAQTITFGDADSGLGLSNFSATDDRVVTLKDHLPGFGGGGGHLTLVSAGKKITLQGDGGNKTIGTGGNALASLSVLGNTALNNIDTTNVPEFNILGATPFVDVGGITSQINEINIGAAEPILGIVASNGSYTIDANGGNVGILGGGKTINFKHADATLVLQNSAAGNGTITLNAILDPGAPNKGKLVVDSGAAGGKIILASVGNATYGTAVNRLQELEFRGNGTFQVDTDIFANDLELSVAAITYNKDINSNLTFGTNTALTQNGNINGDIDFNNQAAVITLGNNNNITGSVTSSNGVNGTIIASGASTIKGPITNLAMLKVGAGAVSITQGGNTSITEIQGNGTALLTLPANFKLTGAINATGGQALKLNFTNGGSVSGIVGNEVGDITTAGAMSFASSVNAKGTATFGGTTSFADTFTNTGPVILAKGSTYNFAKNVTATSFKADGATMNFGNSLAFNSDITGSGTTISLGANQVTYTGTGSFTDTLNLNTTFDGAAKSGGNILIKSGSTLDLSGVSTLALAITTTNFDINNIDPDTKYTVISAETAGGLKPTPADNVKVTVNNENRFVKFTFDTSTLTLFAEDIAEEVIEEDFAPGGPLANIPNAANIKKSLELMEDAPNGSDARQALNNWGELTPIQEANAVTRLMQDVVKLSDVIDAVNNQIINHISSNFTVINTRFDRMQPANNLVTVGAGDEDENAKFGAWATPFIGNATQKKKGNTSGYKADSTGGTIGVDGLVGDDLLFGAAYTRADTDTKLKDVKTGDKSKVHSDIYSLYGLYNLPYDNFFVEGIASYSDSKMRSKSRCVIATAPGTIAYQTANGKYKSESYTGQLMAGYTYAMPENVNLTPLAGVRYSTIKDKGYKETGTTYQNLLVKGKNYNTFDGLLGAKVSSNINVGEVVLTPELYAMVDYAFKNKAPAIDARLQGMTAPFPTNSFKPKKTSFYVGASITAKHKMMEYGINYDTNIGSKYFAQQGSVKVRVNF